MADSLNAYLYVGAILFALGMLGVLVRRSLIVVLLSVELMLQGVNLTMGAFGVFNEDMGGYMLTLASLTIAASESVVGLAILVAVSRKVRELYTDRMDGMKW
ncbi:MAG TPA: NADH-quinone oxidoreductase subunit NuoK [Chloroflexota bacterium]|jgi:NADH-quinone oxidoreductase subunit K|nr:NADH-quinone oxidoreductase subunit NuoK [Chloroflexota bacterium]